MNHNIFCTLFDSNYLDKGIVLHKSLLSACNVFKLYIFAFDDNCYSILKELNLKNTIVISLADFETKDLISLKKERSKAEYCWTCTPITIEYVLKHYNEDVCTYIDADMFFYKDPQDIFTEMELNNKSVIIVEHRFPKKLEDKKTRLYGKYCVEFNTFLNTEQSLKCLEWWKESCIRECHYSRDPNKTIGDQSYLEEFEARFGCVLSTTNRGAGVAPWNTKRYFFYLDGETLRIEDGSIKYDVIFYHFQGIRFLPFGLININSFTNSKFVKNYIYKPYLIEILDAREMLHEKFGLDFSLKKSVTKNPFLRFIQKYISPFYVRNFNNLICEKELRIKK